MNLKNAWITIHAEEPSLIKYSKVKIRGNELHFYLKDELIFKVWLNSYNYTDIIEAGKSVKINFCDEKKRTRLSKENRKNLIGFLEEYLILFKNKKEHQKAHKKEPCPKCELVKKLLRELKDD